MKKKITILVVVITCVALFYLLASMVKIKRGNEIKITTSFYPIYVAVLNITDGVEDVRINNLTNNSTGCLHDYTLTTTELSALSDSDMLVINGAGMESFINKVILNYPNLNIIDASKGIELLKDEDEDEYNGHIFVSVSNYIKQIENITEGLGKLNPKNKEKYIQNSQEYIAKLNSIVSELENIKKSLRYKNIVTYHDSFDYLAKDLDLNVVGTIESEHGKNPSAGEIANLVKRIKENNVKAIFVEPENNTSIANTVAKEANVKLYVLNSTTTGDGTKDSYMTQMKENINTLKEALV